MKDQETNVKALSQIEANDIQKILDRILVETTKKYPQHLLPTLHSFRCLNCGDLHSKL